MNTKKLRTSVTFAACLQFSLIFPVLANAAELISLGQGIAGAVSDDGSVVAGEAGVWREADDWTFVEHDPLPGYAGKLASHGGSLSADGSILVGQSRGGPDLLAIATVWRDGQETIALGHFESEANAITPDGKVIVGGFEIDDTQDAFRWTEEEGLVGLGATRPRNVRAKDVSQDGSVIVGIFGIPASTFRWTEETGVVDLEFNSGGHPIQVSADGHTVVGYLVDPNDRVDGITRRQAYRWTENTGLEPLGWLPEDEDNEKRFSGATGVNADGSVIVGSSGEIAQSERKGFIWTEEYGMEDLRQALIDRHGLDENSLDGLRLRLPRDLSANGRFIAGRDRVDTDDDRAWLVRLDRPFVIPGDYSPDGMVNVEDIDLQAAAMSELAPNLALYDENDDGLVDFVDRSIWITEHAQTWAGDADLDQDVDFADFLSLSTGFGQAGGSAKGDFDGNGMVAFEDFLMLSDNFGNTLAPAQAIPEPSTLGLAVLGLLAMVSVRHKRNQA